LDYLEKKDYNYVITDSPPLSVIQHRLYAKLIKCIFYQKKIHYLGHIISTTWIEVDPENIVAIRGWPSPNNVAKVRSFMGLVGYYRRFIKFHSKSKSKVKKLDLSKVKCFHCHKHGHLATNCLQKRKNKTVVGAVTSEALVSQFELDFSLIACMASSASGSMWYLDSGASYHMTGDKESFSDLEENYLIMHIDMGDDG
jgi:hypothetical protein